MKIISMKQLRENFDPILKGIKSGEEYLLLYRSQPLCTITPYKHQGMGEISAEVAANNSVKSAATPATANSTASPAKLPKPVYISSMENRVTTPSISDYKPTPRIQDQLVVVTPKPAPAVEQTSAPDPTPAAKTLSQYGIRSLLNPK